MGGFVRGIYPHSTPPHIIVLSVTPPPPPAIYDLAQLWSVGSRIRIRVPFCQPKGLGGSRLCTCPRRVPGKKGPEGNGNK